MVILLLILLMIFFILLHVVEKNIRLIHKSGLSLRCCDVVHDDDDDDVGDNHPHFNAKDVLLLRVYVYH